ncbi:MAG TPA: PrpF domain-containing protein [Chloroflexota bacterium]
MQARIPAVFMRGGTSRALFFREEDLPADPGERDYLFLAALGSPDPYGRQLDGLGGGISSLSKVAVIGPPSAPGAAVNYTFGQVEVDRPAVDYRGNCGNISSAVGPYAIDEGLIAATEPLTDVTFLNTNTGKRIVAHVPVADGAAATRGDYALPGVAGTGARIALEFLDPGGAVTGRLLPTGQPRDELEIPGVGRVTASLVDATNPMVYLRAADLGLTGTEHPAALDADRALMDRLERIRAEAAVRMGMAPDARTATEQSRAVPKIAVVAPPRDYADLSGGPVRRRSVDLVARVISMEQAHRAFALTGAMCLAVAAHVPGTVVAEATGPLAPGQDVRIGHPSGVLAIAATVRAEGDTAEAVSVCVYRTARRLMEGWVRVPPRAAGARSLVAAGAAG